MFFTSMEHAYINSQQAAQPFHNVQLKNRNL